MHPATGALLEFVFRVSLAGLPEVRVECAVTAAPPSLHDWCRTYGHDPAKLPMLFVQGYVDRAQLGGGHGLHAGATLLIPGLA
jgi:hypothetical protein